ncbi:hypothetical protein EYZ11_001845 [Aspergillus tanneri]|uniref:NEDD8-activating enzyme E1 regulatory subunit n=1 Tax=Aspergillus tanneri TaxID=1220188 RepID=A0A4S3JSA2_9EURO|nr:uncharacterized protein ATNIH1004_003629 [Aspergillus tanneri]KAA8650939.1 hypothetical protein ATNIH1004_003629 [Aspergillus tanneri]THC98642.1 hypothetical protein EYZ11_001845 [Aspergillus tanneri]
MTEAFHNALGGPSSKERKYDRQLRLWATSGQQALENSWVLLVNSDGPWTAQNTGVSGVAGVETLKNLVLPGIGGFTVVDPAVVTESDLGVNFFLEEGSLGKPRAEETCRLLRELNPDVDGSFHQKPVTELLQDPAFLPTHKLVVISGPMKSSSLDALCGAAREYNIPVIYVRSVGFYSSFSVQLPALFPIVETHPDPETTQDLRLLTPWPELTAAAASVSNLDSMDDHQHGHVPYILLLLHYLEKWKQTHNGNVPSNYKEKFEFREMARSSARTNNPEGGEENYDEAVAAVLKALNPFSLRSSVREVFETEECMNLKPESTDFWIIAAAVREFYDKHKVLPLSGSLPDMKAQSADYVALQNIYKMKARKDMEEVTNIVRKLESQLEGCRFLEVQVKEIELFCKNAAHIKVIKGRAIPRIDNDAHTLKMIRNNLSNAESRIPIYIAFEILDSVITEVQGNNLTELLENETVWSTHVNRIIDTLNRDDPATVDDDARQQILDAVQELRRTEGGELHNISALTGGLVAQEALKVLTRQYVPLDNTCIFDGVRSSSEMYRL